jgi:hypothetical protein
LKAETFPERRAFLRPNAEDAVIGGERLDAFQKNFRAASATEISE